MFTEFVNALGEPGDDYDENDEDEEDIYPQLDIQTQLISNYMFQYDAITSPVKIELSKMITIFFVNLG